MGLSLWWTTGRAENQRAENCLSAPPYSRSHRCPEPVLNAVKDRSPALPYPPHEHLHFITSGGGSIFEVKKGAFSKLISWYNYQRWVHFRG